MSNLTRLKIRSSLLLAIFSVSLATAHAQSAKPSDDVILQSLLNEVRLLRETLQWTNLNAHRSQIIVERIRSQNDRVARITRMLEDTRDQIANLPSGGCQTDCVNEFWFGYEEHSQEGKNSGNSRNGSFPKNYQRRARPSPD